MDNLTIFIIIIASLLLIGIVLTIISIIIKKKYINFVIKNSKALKDLDDLNKKYKFHQFNTHLVFEHKFDNKGHYYKVEPIAYLSKIVRDNYSYYFELVKNIYQNKELEEIYNDEIKKIRIYIDIETCASNKMNYKQVHKYEAKLFNKKMLFTFSSISIEVKLSYSSPKGKANLSKKEKFNEINLKRIVDSVSTKRVDKETYKRLVNAERGLLSDSMRYDVLRRDNFRCVLCGMSAKDGAILHVDHIIPISKGGKTEYSNLRTLCEKCNIGKSNKIE